MAPSCYRILFLSLSFFFFFFFFLFFLNFYCLELSLSRILVALLPDLIALGGKCHWNGNEQRHPRRFDLFLSVVAGREAPPCRQRHLTIDSEFFFFSNPIDWWSPAAPWPLQYFFQLRPCHFQVLKCDRRPFDPFDERFVIKHGINLQ